MAKPRFTEEQSLAKIKYYTIIKTLCQAEQDGHRAMIRELKLLQKRLGIRFARWNKMPLINDATMSYDAVDKELKWRQAQIEILEFDRTAAHNQIKYHSKRITTNESEIVCA